jgi:NAD(P)-dependent dehydrogenase (short-subunit alcohol dehydrogenase family)
MSLYSMLAGKGENGFGYGSTAEVVTAGIDLAGKTVLVTGCNSGLGLETARVLALRGAHVVGTARTADKARAALSSLTGGRTTGLACELSEPASVRACVAAAAKLGARFDAVVCNAGIMALPKREVLHGQELQFLTNHVGHFILATGLLDQLTDDGRVVVLSSAAHRTAPRGGIRFDDLSFERGYSPWTAYGQSKFANLLFAKELARRLEGTRKTANAVHPGVIATNLSRHMNPLAVAAFALGKPLVLKSVGEGAATQTYVAVHPGAAAISGKYWQDCNVAAPRPDAEDPALAARLWEVTEKIVAAL